MAKDLSPEIFNDSFQNYKVYGIPKAQLILTDVPYVLGNNAYASNPSWYIDGDNKKGESDKAGKQFFSSDSEFRPAEFMHFCSKMLIKEPKEVGKSPCMVMFCEFEHQFKFIELGKKYGLNKYINLVFRKNFSAQVLKANMKIVGNCEYGLVLYRDKLPKFNGGGRMVFNCFDWVRDNDTPRIHPCLPAGEKVYINNKWMNIEDVKVGDKSLYGEVIEVTTHQADEIVEIITEDGISYSISNHPFLILRGNEISWCEASKITNNDFILWNKRIIKIENPQKKDILELGKEKLKWSTSLYGKSILEKSPMDIKYTISMGTKPTIELKIYSLSLPLNTNGYTKVASLSLENGINHVLYAENIKNAMKKIGISAEELSMGRYAKNATLKKQLRTEEFELKMVGSVRTIQRKTKVYNLTISGIPAFDTSIGISHNTQKPVPLLERLIEIFTDPGDVVIDPCAGSGTSLLAAANLGRKAYGFEVNKQFFNGAKEKVLKCIQPKLF